MKSEKTVAMVLLSKSGRISTATGPNNMTQGLFVARGVYYICSHHHEVGFPQVVAARFARCIGVRHCNGLWSHCILAGST
jgi:hypothetical protein